MDKAESAQTHSKKRRGGGDDGKGSRSKRSKCREPVFANKTQMQHFMCAQSPTSNDKLYGPEDAGTADTADNQNPNEPEDKPDVDDIEAAIAAEISGINAKGKAKDNRITSIKLDTPCCGLPRLSMDSRQYTHNYVIFFHTKEPVDPAELVGFIFKDIEETKRRQTRFTNRLTPITKTCKANITDLEETAHEVLKPHFHEGQKGVKFAIRPNLRDHRVLNRDEIIKSVARIVGPDHKVDLKNYDLLIIVEVWRNICGVSVVRDFEHYKRFNLGLVADQSEGLTNEKACGVAPE
ncbi:hypothetical protein TWF703_010085 [Orbilia oligospora]|uniref:THUMP domain-containing protein n=1 Tax=Orbilia oligospora TaxID=2813651 RepID=A0A7C8JM17_ORBOL|nr:hypothetical protein TWF703_010085 [Orbilia oligospora]